MKKLVCELCGNNNFTKENDIGFVTTVKQNILQNKLKRLWWKGFLM
ncbi:hypothetical protein [Lactococcus lactis]|nr:hypothetical protein [Lactococcus lactis]